MENCCYAVHVEKYAIAMIACIGAAAVNGLTLKGKLPYISAQETEQHYPLSVDTGGLLLNASMSSSRIEKAQSAFRDDAVVEIHVTGREQCGQVSRVKAEVTHCYQGTLKEKQPIEIVENISLFTYNNGERIVSAEGLNPVMDYGGDYLASIHKFSGLSSLYELTDDSASVYPIGSLNVIYLDFDEISAEQLSEPYILQIDPAAGNAFIQNALSDPGYAHDALNAEAPSMLASAQLEAYQRAAMYLNQ